MERFAERFRTRQWPSARPLPEVYFNPRSLGHAKDKKSCMHAKCVVVDARRVLITSANFTEAAQHRNIEVGLIVHSDPLAGRITRFFSSMITEGLLARLPLPWGYATVVS